MSGVVLVARQELISGIRKLAVQDELRVSDPIPIDPVANSLNWELSPGEIKPICDALTIIFSTGTVGLVFLSKLRSFIKGEKIEIRDAKTGKSRGHMSSDSSDDDLLKFLD